MMLPTRIEAFMVFLTSQVKAQSLVAAHLGSDMTSLRCSGQRVIWRGMEGGGEHVVSHQGRAYRVDLVLGTVTLRVGTVPECMVEL